ncbi:MAG: stage II sporulation protein P [Moorellaceae bacterium]
MNIYFITNWHTRRVWKVWLRALFFLLAIFLCLRGSGRLTPFFRQVTATIAGYSYSLPLSFWEAILNEGMPTLILKAGDQPGYSDARIWPSALQALNPSLAQFLSAEEEYPLPEGQESPPPPPPLDLSKVEEGSQHPLVAIYNTHNAEAYAPSDGVEKVPGKNGSIVTVAATLAQSLIQEYGIPVVRSDTIHDYPDFTLAYANSEKTVRHLLAEYPSIQVVLDIHRDAGLQEPPIAYIDHQEVAQILIIVGSDARLEHPHWRQNEAFARRLAAKMDELYPGLCRGVRVQQGRYNQHLHPRALLLEIGSSNNTLDQAERAAGLLARVIAEVLRDLRQENPWSR